MAEKKKILFIVEAMGGGVFTYIVDLANELVKEYEMYIAYAVRNQTPENYHDYFDKKIKLIKVKNFERSVNPIKDLKAFFEIKRIAKEVHPDIIHLHSSNRYQYRNYRLGRTKTRPSTFYERRCFFTYKPLGRASY